MGVTAEIRLRRAIFPGTTPIIPRGFQDNLDLRPTPRGYDSDTTLVYQTQYGYLSRYPYKVFAKMITVLSSKIRGALSSVCFWEVISALRRSDHGPFRFPQYCGFIGGILAVRPIVLVWRLDV